MYESYYGFSEKPFSLTPDPKYAYRSESHANAIELLQYAIARREGFVVITGDTGTGKTTLCRALAEKVDRRTFTALVLNPFNSEEDLLRAILEDLGVVSRGEEHAGTRRPTKQELVSTLHDFLLSLVPIGARAVLVIDEAQRLPLSILEQIRILSNFETDREKLLQIFLVGQLSLAALLRLPELRQLDQRVSIRYQLKPLREEEVAGYVAHRLAVVNPAHGVVFSPTALRAVHDCTGGIPRLINLLCDRALADGSASRTTHIDEALVATAADALDLKPVVRSTRSLLTRLLGRSRL
jgi:general secretion pathway protein A